VNQSKENELKSKVEIVTSNELGKKSLSRIESPGAVKAWIDYIFNGKTNCFCQVSLGFAYKMLRTSSKKTYPKWW